MANRYWVGGNSTWDGTAGLKWALTSGGAGGQAVPTTSDTVFFNGNSGTLSVPIGTGAVCSTLTMTGFTGQLAFGTNTITVAGSGTVFTGATSYGVSGTPLILVTNATATARTINAGSVTEANSISFNINNGGSTLTVTGAVRDLIFSGSFAGSFPNGALTIYGNLTFKLGMTITAGTSTRTFAATSGTQTITSATRNLDFPLTFSGTATYQLQDALAVGTTTSRTITLTSGTLDLNGFVLTNFGIFSSSNSNTRSIIFGGGNYTNTLNSAATVVSMTIGTGFTYTGTPTFNITGNTTGVTTTVSITSGIETNSLNINVSSGAGTVALSGTFKNINLTGFTGTLSNSTRTIYGNLIIPSVITALTAGTSVTTFAATNGTQQITSGTKILDFPITFSGTATYQLQDALAVGTTTSRTITLTSGTLDLNNFTLTLFGVFSSSNTNTRSIVFGSTGSIVNTLLTGTGWSMADLTNFSFTGTSNVQFTGIAGSFTVQHGTTNGSEAQALSFAFDSSPTTLTLGTSYILDLTLLSSFRSSTSPTFSPTTLSIYGSYLDQSTQNFTALVALNLIATLKTTNYITVTSNYPPTTVTVNAGSGVTYKLLTQALFSTLNIQSSFDSNSINFTTLVNFNFNNSNTKTLTINSNVVIFIGSFIGSVTGTTFNLTGSTIKFQNAGTFNVPNATFPLVVIDSTFGNIVTIGASGTSQTITTLQVIPSTYGGGNIATIKLYADSTSSSTLNVTNLSIDGNSLNNTVLSSSTAAYQATISKPSGTVITNYLTIKDSAATGGATWLAPSNYGNINNGNNTGWIFGAYSANNSNFLAFF